MKVIDPYPVTAENLLYTSIAANSEATWSSATTYAQDALVKVTGQFPNRVYRSLRGNNTNRYPPDWLEPVQESATSATSLLVGTGAKTLTVQTGKGFSAGMVVEIAYTSTPKTVHMTGEITSYDSGTGALAVSVYSSTGEGTLADWTITTEDEIGYWEEVGSTNQHAMFDRFVNTQTESLVDGYINTKHSVGRADFVALFGLLGQTVELTLRDETETTVLWSETIALAYGSAVNAQVVDWYEYFFGEYIAQTDITRLIDALTFNGVLEIKITANPGQQARCGTVVIGRQLEIGSALYGAKAGVIDFSRRETDEQGRTALEQGYWSKTIDITLLLPNRMISAVYARLAALRGIPTAWIGVDDGYEMLVVYGAFSDFGVTISGPNYSYCDLSVEGLI